MTAEDYYKKAKANKSNKGKTDKEIREISDAKYKYDDLVESLELDTLFSNIEEIEKAKQLVSKYLNNYAFDNISDRQTLRQVIYLEVFNDRLQDCLNKLHEQNKIAPITGIDGIHKNIDKILELKETLGLIKDSKDDKAKGFDFWSLLMKKAKNWLESNQGTRTLACGHCGKMLMLKIRTDKWDCIKHPFFQDRLLANEHLIRLYLEKKITDDDIAKILNCSPQYVDWLVRKLWVTNPYYRKVIQDLGVTLEDASDVDETTAKEASNNDRKD
jgi:DNA-directed RNA polymerase subunit RPC12/RpoP